MDRLTVLPFIVAMLIAVASMPTDVFLVNTGQMGIEHDAPWRSSSLGPIRHFAHTVSLRLQSMVASLRGHPIIASQLGEVSTDLLTFGAAGANQLKVLRARADDIRRELAALNGTVTGENRAMTDGERVKLKELQTRMASVKEQLEVAEQLNADERETAARVAATADAARARGEQPLVDGDAVASASARATGGARIELGADNRLEEAKAPGFFGKALIAVKNYAANGGWTHISAEEKRVITLMGTNGRPMAAATGMNTDIASDGGFLVGRDRSTSVIQRAYSTGEILSRITPMPISAASNGMTMPAIDETSRADGSRYGGIASGWLGQGNTLTSGKPKFREMDLKLRKVGAFVYATNEQLMDSIALEAWVNRYLPLELRFRVEDALMNGVGSNQPLGATKSGALITVTRNTATRILSEDLRAMVLRLWAPLWGSAVFLVDQSTLGEFDQLAIPIGTGGALDPSYKPAGSVPGQKYATYKNIPIIPVEYCAALGTSGDIALVSWDEYTLIDKGGVDAAVSLHVAFLTDEQVFRFIYRVDGQLNWNSALTPKSGGDTLSAVVVLS